MKHLHSPHYWRITVRPPLLEMIIEFQFAELTAWLQAHIGAFGTRIRDHYPLLLDQPLIDERVVAWDFADSVRPSRGWFLSEQQDRLIPLQDERIAPPRSRSCRPASRVTDAI